MVPCCCCRDVYTRRQAPLGLARVRVDLRDAKSRLIAGRGTDDYIYGSIRMDFKNRRLYGNAAPVGGSGVTTTLFTFDESFENRQLVFTDPNAVPSFMPLPEHELIFYANTNSPTNSEGYIKRVNYDGTGVTTLTTHTGSGPATVAVPSLAVAKDEPYVFYHRSLGTGTKNQIRRIGRDGSGDTLIFEATNVVDDSHFLFGVQIDNTHSKVLWTYLINADSRTYFYRANFDGSAPETYYSVASADGPLHFWSHKLERVFYYSTGSNVRRGFWAVNYDGTGAEVVVDDSQWAGQLVPSYIAPGCGFETTGPGYEV